MTKQKLISKTNFARKAGVSPAAITKACKARLVPATVGKRIDAAHPTALEYIALQRRAANGAPDPVYAGAVDFCVAAGVFTIVSVRRKFGISHSRAKGIIEDMKSVGIVPTSPTKKKTRGKKAGRPPAKKKRGRGRPTSQDPPPAPKPRIKRGREAAKETRKNQPPRGVVEPGAPGFEIPEHIQIYADMTVREVIKQFGTEQALCDFLTAVKSIEVINEKRIKNAQQEGVLVSRDLVRRAVIEPFNAAHMRMMKDGSKSLVGLVIAKHSSGMSAPEIEGLVSELLGSFIRPVKEKITRVLRGLYGERP